jgi:hypothetical protein
VVTDFGADVAFAQVMDKLVEHYGVVLGESTIRRITVSFRQACMKSIDILANVSCEFNPMRSAADGREGEGRASWGAWREPEAGSGAVQTLA